VINWGFQNEPGVTLRLGDGGWESTQVTSTDGYFQFGALGQGVAFLSPDLTPGQAETLRPMADEVAIRLRCDLDLVANLGLYSSPDRPDPPATLTMGVSRTALVPGGNVIFSLTLRNGMPNPISHVLVTDYLPEGLIVTDVTTSRGTSETLDERMVSVAMGDVPQGAKETIQITAQAARDLPYGTHLKNTASLLYAESAADQAWTTLTIGGAEAAAVATPTPLPSTLPAQPDTPTPATTAAVPEVTPTPLPSTPSADQTPGPTDDLLPVTGGGAGVALPGVGIALAIVVLGIRRLRSWLAAN
jgi:uncharacterized repeat protein (TIGR01451 family)